MKDKIIYWLNDGNDIMIPYRYLSKARQALKAFKRMGFNLSPEVWQYAGYYEWHGFTEKELKDLNMSGYIPAYFMPSIARAELLGY
tara:strand:+ start:35 stop:292 length:258 start_codon:yes stop_codon:yes gene_type:complete